jgi:hypothetical protein
MIPKLFKFITSLLLISLIIFSCKKQDNQFRTQESKNSNKFFDSKKIQDTSVLKILNNLKQKNEQIPFVDKLVKVAGLPLWDKAILYKSTQQINFNAKSTILSTNSLM